MKVPVVVNNSTTNHLGWWGVGGRGGGLYQVQWYPLLQEKVFRSTKAFFSSTTFLIQRFRKMKHHRPCPQEWAKETGNFTVDLWSSLVNIYIWKLQKQSCECHQFWILHFCVYDIMNKVKCVAQVYIRSWANLFLVFIVIILSWPCVVDRTSGTSH